ncbi:dihydropyrimidinase [Amaricoccus tamworthensis]|uniref:dihydropyrimidinase n=1 Tax=Amaricoccus tamworthensis TaxID=57002 RepID=UPI003C7BA6F8
MFDTLIANGTVVTADHSFKADIGIKDGRIAAIGSDLGAATEVVDAAGKLLLPGGVDVHTHLDSPVHDFFSADDFETGTIAAACGGTTTIIDFVQQAPGQSLSDAIATWDKKAIGKASIDYGYHIIITDMTDAVFEELATLPERGIPSFKIFMAYKGAQMVDDLTLIRALWQARESGALVMVHAENGDAAYFLQKQFLAAGKTAPKYHAETRPPRVEAEATARAIALAEIVDAPVFVVHLTCEEALEEVIRGKERGVEVLAETCIQYLHATKDDLARPGFEGAKFVFTPPARTAHDHEVLWSGLADGVLENVSSDHAAAMFKGGKDHAGTEDFTLIPNGGPGIEERMMMFWRGVREGRISQEKFVELTATRPAKVFGLYPRKGALEVGADADIVLWDPEAQFTIANDRLHHNVDFTNYDGQAVHGAPDTVLLRGVRVVEGRDWVGEVGAGVFLPRDRFQRQAVPRSIVDAAE